MAYNHPTLPFPLDPISNPAKPKKESATEMPDPTSRRQRRRNRRQALFADLMDPNKERPVLTAIFQSLAALAKQFLSANALPILELFDNLDVDDEEDDKPKG